MYDKLVEQAWRVYGFLQLQPSRGPGSSTVLVRRNCDRLYKHVSWGFLRDSVCIPEAPSKISSMRRSSNAIRLDCYLLRLHRVPRLSFLHQSLILDYREWCKQSFMTTLDYKNAMAGLHNRRLYMRFTYPARQVSRTATVLGRLCRTSICGLFGRRIPFRSPELSWTKDHKSMSDRIASAVECELRCDGEQLGNSTSNATDADSEKRLLG